jgi:hypothetical protein
MAPGWSGATESAVAPRFAFAIVPAASRSLGTKMADYTGQNESSEFMKEHLKTWHGFLKFAKWLVIGSIILLAVLLIWRTHNG